jgi:hypothetical protein
MVQRGVVVHCILMLSLLAGLYDFLCNQGCESVEPRLACARED